LRTGLYLSSKAAITERPNLAPQQPLVVLTFQAFIRSSQDIPLFAECHFADAGKRFSNLILVSKILEVFDFNIL